MVMIEQKYYYVFRTVFKALSINKFMIKFAQTRSITTACIAGVETLLCKSLNSPWLKETFVMLSHNEIIILVGRQSKKVAVQCREAFKQGYILLFLRFLL